MKINKIFLKNGIAAIFQKIVKVLDQLIVVPFFISAWGGEFYGEWLTLMIVPAVLGFSDMGFGTAAANSFVLNYAANEKKKAADIFCNGFFAISGIVFFGIIASVGIVFLGQKFNFFKSSIIPYNDAVISVLSMIAARVISFYQQLYEARFNAARKYYISINANGCYSLVSMLLNICVLVMGFGIVIFSLVNLFLSVFYTFIYIIYAKKVLPFDDYYKGKLNFFEMKSIFKKGLGYLMSPVWQIVFFQGTTLVVRVLLGPMAVTIFNTVRTVTRTVNQFYTMVISASISELQFEIGNGDMEKARKIFRVGLVFVFVIAIFGVGFLLFYGEFFYKIWTKKALNPPSIMWNIFIFGILFNAIWWPSSFVFQATNKPKELAYLGVGGAVLAVSSSYVFCVFYGLNGAAMGSVVMDLFLCISVLPRACRLIEQPVTSLPKDIFLDLQKMLKR